MPKAVIKALFELTGQVEIGPAILITLKDAVEHRLDGIIAQIRSYERRYEMTFEQFEARGRSGDLQDCTSFETERDYFDWDGLITRQRKLSDILEWLA
ncbi:MAG: hypothetical protein FJ010_08745 [Chloroflexi bacterium]|nr:hypothetical protein [Chloroflexota bacterium]